MPTAPPYPFAASREGPGAAVGITESLIHDQVHTFYGKVRDDPALGPIFRAAITDWDHHLQKMCDFWSAVLLMTGRFKGAPMAVHAALPTIRPTHFARWLHLFAQTAHEVCPPDAAEVFIVRSRIIGEALQLHLASVRRESAWILAAILGEAAPEDNCQ